VFFPANFFPRFFTRCELHLRWRTSPWAQMIQSVPLWTVPPGGGPFCSSTCHHHCHPFQRLLPARVLAAHQTEERARRVSIQSRPERPDLHHRLLPVTGLPVGGVWVHGGSLCVLSVYSLFTNFYTSDVLLCCIAMDRYLAVVHPLMYTSLRKVDTASAVSVAIWVMVVMTITWEQARAQTFWGAGAQTKKKGTRCHKKNSARVEALASIH